MISKIRDFIYNKNDILIAFLIMVLAVGVIGWRVKALFDYPKQLISGNGSETQSQEEAPPQGSQGENDPSGQAGQQPGESGQPSEQGEGQGGTSQTPGSGSAPPASGAIPSQDDGSTWSDDGKLTRDFTIKVKGASATEAIQCLVEWELFKDYEEYKEICQSLGLDDEKVSGGTFTFEKGLTKKEIAEMVNWS